MKVVNLDGVFELRPESLEEMSAIFEIFERLSGKVITVGLATTPALVLSNPPIQNTGKKTV